ncbi:hypothetical protein HU200_010621 [Digitaria exilis]|uniref:Uncharacterized protein n=1 Tax=Digitaria exilis TaxID=1010633 RepID=A0A835FIU9_9POAL|nr:hypothetical protein HU200_010621 [Digitaria exilis]
MARHRSLPYRASLVLLVLVGLLLSSFATATPTLECGGWGRKLLVTAPRVSPDTRSSPGSQQEMVIGGWRWGPASAAVCRGPTRTRLTTSTAQQVRTYVRILSALPVAALRPCA